MNLELITLLVELLKAYGPLVFVSLVWVGSSIWVLRLVLLMHKQAVGELKQIRESLVGQAPRLEVVEDAVLAMRPDLKEVQTGVKELIRRRATP